MSPFDAATEIATQRARHANDGWRNLDRMTLSGVSAEELLIMAVEHNRRSVVSACQYRKPKPEVQSATRAKPENGA